MSSRKEGNLLLVVETANNLEGKRTNPNGHESLEVDAYAVDIKRVENPFVKDDEDSDDDNGVSGHPPKLEFHSAKSVFHAKMVHNAKEKKRRRNLKQAQLTLHQELQPYSHQKPVLRTILCTAIDEIKKLKQIAEDNGNCLAVLRNERDSLAEKLELRKALDNFPKHKEEYSNDDNNVSHKCDHSTSTGQQSVKCDCLLDDEESDYTQSKSSSEQTQTNDYKETVVEDNQDNEKHPATSCSELPIFTNPLFTSPLYCTTTAQFAALQAQSIQLAQLQTFTNPIWLPPFVWPNLNSLYSTVTGNQVNGTNSLYEKQHSQLLNGVNGHVRKEVGSESYSTAVKCSVVKTTGNVDKRNQSCVLPKSKVTKFTIDNLVKTV
ncbi:uncharacterized protein [Dysidea avara]|uniref:uncharacterized protein isoform X2 n=1 Tax=Dysidea avara TaxID=196820 RepID=UPI00332AC0FB